jgi:crotonobetainyl-CoA:carnitine CoA-transferase CaiB-like acyl-CoA transferase
MNVAMWAMSPDIVGTPFSGNTGLGNRMESPNPLVNTYKTKDERWLYLVCLQPDRYWDEICTRLDRPDLITDERFADAGARYNNRHEAVATLDAVFGALTLDQVHEKLDAFTGVWAPVLKPSELGGHPQVGPNGFMPTITPTTGDPFQLVTAPMRFDDQATVPQGAAPELGQHTEEILLETGLDWDEIGALRECGALG